MGHLFRKSDRNYTEWSSGFASYLTDYKQGCHGLSVAVRCRIGDLEAIDLALLDTGAEWSVISGDTATILGDQLGPPSETIRMNTRLGTFSGALHRVNITLLAEENCGYDLTVEGSVFISENWDGPTVLGYRGFMERIRIALDPGVIRDQQIFFFGSVDR
jgi:hypothetical protein